jgi:hypothetical protein
MDKKLAATSQLSSKIQQSLGAEGKDAWKLRLPPTSMLRAQGLTSINTEDTLSSFSRSYFPPPSTMSPARIGVQGLGTMNVDRNTQKTNQPTDQPSDPRLTSKHKVVAVNSPLPDKKQCLLLLFYMLQRLLLPNQCSRTISAIVLSTSHVLVS